VVVAWLPAGVRHERVLTRALGDDAPIAFCRSEEALFDELARGVGRVVVVELGTGSTPPAHAVIDGVKRRFPHVRTVGFCWLGPATSAEIVACTRAGLDMLALRGYDDLRRVVFRELADEAGDEMAVLHDLSDMLAPELCDWARIVLARASDGPTVQLLARTLGCSPRTLQRVARERYGVGPGDLIESVRVLHAARLLACRHLAVDEVVRATGYASAVMLRRAMRRNQVAPPLGLRGAAAYATARDLIARRLGRWQVVSPATRNDVAARDADRADASSSRVDFDQSARRALG
jgi:transcriptional regulator GlxA family with amidase domain